MTDDTGLESLKARARQGDLTALQELRTRGFFAAKTATEGYPLSHAQERLWLIEQIAEGSAAYNLPQALVLEGDLDVGALQRALDGLVARHESLRTTFSAPGSEPRQFITPAAPMRLREVDLSASPDAEADARRAVASDAATPFDLTRGPLVRASLYRLAARRHLLALNVHHIVADAWSLGLIARDLSVLYGGYPLDPLKTQYRDFAAWQRARSAELAASSEYWRTKLSGDPAPLDLADFPRPAVQTFSGRTESIVIDESACTELERLARQHGASLFMALAALVNVLLFRHSGQRHIVVGTPVSGRDHPDLEAQVGMFVNTVALRTELSPDDSFLDLLDRVRTGALEAYEHQAYPFDQLVGELGLSRDLGRSPLFDVMVSLEHQDEGALRLGSLRALPFDVDTSVAKFDLTFFFTRTSRALIAALNYNTDLFRGERIAAMGGHLRRLVAGVLANPSMPIGRLEMLDEPETRAMAARVERTRTPYDSRPLAELVEEQAALHPDAPAAGCGDVVISYAELNRRADALAARLQTFGLQPEERVGVLLDRSEWVAVAYLAVLKAGGAYLPLMPSYPRSRTEYMLADSACRIVVSEAAHIDGAMRDIGGIQWVDVRSQPTENQERNEKNGLGVSVPRGAGAVAGLANVIYTSGSTGQPKGVLVEQRAIARLVRNTNYVQFGPDDRVLQCGSLGFDASTWEIWGPLLNGGAVYFTPEHEMLEPGGLRALLSRHRITTTFLTATLFNQAVDEDPAMFRGMRQIIAGGERLSPPHVARLRRACPDLVITNGYGPTENTVFTTCHAIDRPPTRDIPIGRPIANSHVLLLDESGELVPDGAVGEICAGGDGLARGYLNDAALTASRFVPHPFLAGERLYRTGDLGRCLPDGVIECLGRVDAQIKLRGHRIEPGEIELKLLEYPGIRQCVVTLRGDDASDRYLVAYVVLRRPGPFGPGGDPGGDLKAHLRASLPEVMVPARIVFVDALPLTANGKIDYRRLPDPPQGTEQAVVDEPQGRLEETLALIWRDLLGLEKVGRHDGFFELGGHSLKAVRLVARVASELNVRLPLQDVFRSPTIAGLADRIRQIGALGVESIPVVEPAPHYALSHAQRRLWMLDRMGASPDAYVIAGAFDLGGDLDPDASSRAVDALVARHESLRTTFIEVDGEPRQVIHAVASSPVGRALSGSARDLSPFDLERGPLFRAHLEPRNGRFLFTCDMSHIVSDGWSVDVILRELIELYAAFTQGREPALPPLRIQYKDYAAWQNAYLAGPAAPLHRDYWHRALAGPLPALDLPADRVRPAVQSFRGGVVSFTLPAGTLGQLQRRGRAAGASEFMVAVALVKALLFRYTRQEDLIVGAPVALREHPDLQAQVGFYVNMLALRDRIAASDTFDDLLGRVRHTVTSALEHRVYPFDRLVEELDVRRDMGRNPVFDCVVTYEHASNAPAAEGLDVRPAPVETSTSKFDLTFSFVEDETGGCDVSIEFSADLFDRDRIDRMASHLGAMATAAAEEPALSIGAIDLLSPGERAQVEAFGRAPSDYPRDSRIAEIFEQRVAEQPDRLAVAFADTQLTYAELNARAEALAARLRNAGVGDDDCVGVLLDRSEQVPVALLGILKAGAAYVPLDASFPDARIRYILENTACRTVVSEPVHAGRFIDAGVEVIDVRAQSPARITPMRGGPPGMRGEPLGMRGGPLRPADSSSLAYVIYTSGSTGEPKGVLVDQRAVLRLVLNTNYAQLGPDDRVLQTGSLAFDASTFEIWGPLLNGGAVCFGHERSLLDASDVRALIARHGVTTMWLTSSLFNGLIDEDASIFTGLRHLLIGGERLSPRHVERARTGCPGLTIVNGYGPTENTTFTACYRVTGPVTGDVPIGCPVANTEILVLDDEQRPVPIGVPGEICAGGDGLARGYLGDPELTLRMFVPHPFRPGDRIYRTGDVGRWRADGMLEYLGRRDRQVKLRGYRIELGEIEHRLAACTGVERAAVTMHTRKDGSRGLVAYVIGAPDLSAAALAKAEGAPLRTYAALRRQLESVLPAYMVPTEYIPLERFPLTPNGKLDYDALPVPDGPAKAGPHFESAGPHFNSEDVHDERDARTPEEAALLRVWQETLGRQVGLADNYFDLGGDSIRAIQIVGRLRKDGWALKVPDLFTHPTIEALALLLQPTPGPKGPGLRGSVGRVLSDPPPLTPIQRWFFESHSGDLHHFNQSVLLRYAARVDDEAIRARLQRLQDEHAALRTTFTGTGAAIEATTHPRGREVAFEDHDLRDSADPAAALDAIGNRLQASLDLAAGPLMKAALFRMPDADRLLIAIHHLVVDGVSWRILLDDLADETQDFTDGALATGSRRPSRGPGSRRPSGLRTDSYADWARAATSDASRARALDEVPYWTSMATADSAALPIDGDATTVDLYGDAEWVSATIEPDATSFLLGPAHRAFGTEINDLLLTALGRALQAWHGGDATRITLEGHGRDTVEGVDVSRTVGWFTTLFPFLLHLPAGEIDAQIHAVRQALRRVPRKGGGYGLLAGSTGPGLRSQSDLSFNYLGQVEAGSAGGPFEFAAEAAGRPISPRLERGHPIDVLAMVTKGRLELSIGFTPARHRRATIETFASQVARELNAVADACRAALQRLPWPSLAIEEIHGLSPMQEGLLFQSVYDADPRSYVVQLTSRIRGPLDLEAFTESWRELCRRHAPLRSAYLHEGFARPMQVVLRDRQPEIAVLDGLETSIDTIGRADLDRGFDLASDPLMRLTILRLSPTDHVVIWSHHHIVMDGWSLGVLNRELIAIYQARCEGRRASLPPAPPYVEYVRWLESRDADAGRRYWKSYLEGYETLTTLPRDLASESSVIHAQRVTELGAEMTTRLTELAAQLQVTLNTVVQALWALLLSRYSGSPDVVFGTIVSGRPADLPRVHDMVGLFISAVPVRVQFGAGEGFADTIRTLLRASLASEAFHYMPLAEIQKESGVSPLFDHLLIFQNYPMEGADPGNGADATRVEQLAQEDHTHYDLALVVVPGESLTVKFSYNAAVLSADWIARIGEHLRSLVIDVLSDPARAAASLDILPAGERYAVVTAFNETATTRRADATVIDRIEAQASRSPDAPAVRCGAATMSYAALIDRASRVARYLVERHGVGPERAVGVLMDRSEQLLAGILGILKAGAAYVPIEAGYPEERRRYMLEDSGAAVLLTDALYQEALAAVPEGTRFDSRARPEELAYVIYTSGSTGRPKGCQVEHRQLTHYLEWSSGYYFDDEAQGTFALYSSLSFDLTITSLFLPLLRGRTLHVCPAALDVVECLLATCTPGSGIDSLKLTPSHIDILRETALTVTDVRVAIVGGEALRLDQVRYLQSLNPRMRVFNEYGPTETTVGCIVHEVSPHDEQVLIGRPIANTRIYILDDARSPVPVGVAGEIYIAGDGVARGYANQPALTAERFVPDPFADRDRAYRTGDRARWLEDGAIEHLGRTDDQVKIRGHRVELQEIEARLREHPAVNEAAVVASGGTLIAYCAGESADVLGHLRTSLPDHMVPSRVAWVERLPLTANGKVNRRALLAMAPQERAPRGAPHSPAEQALARIWEEVLQVPNVSVDDHFFELGGHSLKAMQVVARIQRRLGVDVPLREVFSRPILRDLAAAIEAASPTAEVAIAPAAPSDHYELSHAQKRLWLLHQLKGEQAYNMPRAFVLEGLDVAALQRALSTIVERHEALRTAFVMVDGEPRQKILGNVTLPLAEIDVRADADPYARAREIVNEEAIRPFDLESPPLLRVTAIRVAEHEHVVLLVMHHIIGDGWSMNVLYRELLTSTPLPALRIQYKDFAAWQNARDFAGDERYWIDRLQGTSEGVRLPVDRVDGDDRDFHGRTETLDLAPHVVAGLRALALAKGTTLSTVTLTVFTLVLHHFMKQRDLCIGMSTANRNHPDLENLIGFFVNILPIRVQLSSDAEFGDLVDQVAATVRDALEHQDYPFDLLVQAVNPDRATQRQPLVNVIYAYQSFEDVHVDVGGELPLEEGSLSRARPFDVTFDRAKFDLTLFVAEAGAQLRLSLEYDSSLFRPATIVRILGAMEQFATAVAAEVP